MGRWKVVSATLLVLAGAASASGQPAAGYTFELVEPVQRNAHYPYPWHFAINDEGDVAYGTPSGIYVWNGTARRFIGVGNLGGLNNAGEVAYIAPDRRAVYKWTPSGTITVASGGLYSNVDINNHGAVTFRGSQIGPYGIFKWQDGVVTPWPGTSDATSPNGDVL